MGSADVASHPIIWPTARVCEREDHDVLVCDLIGNRKWKAIEHVHTPIGPVAPLRRCLRESEDQRERRMDRVLQLGPEARLARFVVVDLVINLGNCEPMDSKFHRGARLYVVARALDIHRPSPFPRRRRPLRHRDGRSRRPRPLQRQPRLRCRGCGSIRTRVWHAPREEVGGSRRARRRRTLAQSTSSAGLGEDFAPSDPTVPLSYGTFVAVAFVPAPQEDPRPRSNRAPVRPRWAASR